MTETATRELGDEPKDAALFDVYPDGVLGLRACDPDKPIDPTADDMFAADAGMSPDMPADADMADEADTLGDGEQDHFTTASPCDSRISAISSFHQPPSVMRLVCEGFFHTRSALFI